MDREIGEFVKAIGAKEPSSGHPSYSLFRGVFRRSNYFVLNGVFLIVKISRSEKPFWGVGRKYIELLNGADNYYLVLITQTKDGWFFSKRDVNNNIERGIWRLREKDDNYRINFPLPDNRSFASPTDFLTKPGLGLPQAAFQLAFAGAD